MVQLSAGRPFLLESASARLAVGRSLPSPHSGHCNKKTATKGQLPGAPCPSQVSPHKKQKNLTILGSPLNTGYSQMYLPHCPFLKVTSL